MSADDAQQSQSVLDAVTECIGINELARTAENHSGRHIADKHGGTAWTLTWEDRDHGSIQKHSVITHDASSTSGQAISIFGPHQGKWVVLESDAYIDQFDLVIFDCPAAATGYFMKSLFDVEIGPLMPITFWTEALRSGQVRLGRQEALVLAEMMLTGVYEMLDVVGRYANRIRRTEWAGAGNGEGHLVRRRLSSEVWASGNIRSEEEFARELSVFSECRDVIVPGTAIDLLSWRGGVANCRVCETRTQGFNRLKEPPRWLLDHNLPALGRPLDGPASLKLDIVSAELAVYQRQAGHGVVTVACYETNELGRLQARALPTLASANASVGLLRCLQVFAADVLGLYLDNVLGMERAVERAAQTELVGEAVAAQLEALAREAIDSVLESRDIPGARLIPVASRALDATVPEWREKLEEAFSSAFFRAPAPVTEWMPGQDMVQ